MNMKNCLTACLCGILAAAMLPACTGRSKTGGYRDVDAWERATRNARKAYSHEAFVASENYRYSRDMWRGAALNQHAPAHSYVVILLAEQRGRLYINDRIAMDFPVCSGRVGGHETPTGTFHITEKRAEYRSHSYGSFVDANDNIVKGGIASWDAAPAGSHFKGASMPYWMRFNGAIGMHVGNVHRESDSHGCVRIPEEACKILFSKLGVGSRVIVK